MSWLRWLKLTDNHWIFDLSLWLVLLLPLLFYRNIGYPFEFGRSIMLMYILALLFFGSLVSSNWRATRAWWRSPILWLVFGLLIATWVASWWGVNFYRSFWGIISRNTGLLYLTSLAALAVTLLLMIRQANDWLKIMSVMSWVGALSAAVAILQKIGITLFYQVDTSERMGGLVGNPIFLGMFLIPTLFLALYFWSTTASRIRWLYLFSGLIQIVGLLLTSSRGPFFGLLIGLAIFALGWLWLKRPSRRNLLVIAIASPLALLATGALLYWLPFGQRLLQIGLNDPSIQSRLFTWSIAWRAFLAHPWLGYGRENVGHAFNTFYQAKFGGFGFGETLVDRAHNFILDQLLTTGIMGTALLLGAIVLGFIILIRRFLISRMADPRRSMLLLTILSLGSAYLISDLTGFDNVTTLLYLSILFPAVIFFTSPVVEGTVSLHWWKLLPLLLLLPYLVLDVRYLPQSWVAGRYAIAAERAVEQGANHYATALTLYRRVQRTSRNPYQSYMLTKFPSFSRNYAIDLINQNKLAEANERITDGLHVLEQIRPAIADNYSLLQDEPILYMLLSVIYPSDPRYIQTAKEKFNDLISQNPNREYLYLNWARVLLDFDMFDEAKSVLTTAANLSVLPKELEFWRAMWGVFSRKSDTDSIVADFKLGVSKSADFMAGDELILSKAVDYLVDKKEWSTAEYYQKVVVKFSPKAVIEHVTLATIYANQGKFNQAETEARLVLKLDPTQTAAVSDFLTSIGRQL